MNILNKITPNSLFYIILEHLVNYYHLKYRLSKLVISTSGQIIVNNSVYSFTDHISEFSVEDTQTLHNFLKIMPKEAIYNSNVFINKEKIVDALHHTLQNCVIKNIYIDRNKVYHMLSDYTVSSLSTDKNINKLLAVDEKLFYVYSDIYRILLLNTSNTLLSIKNKTKMPTIELISNSNIRNCTALLDIFKCMMYAIKDRISGLRIKLNLQYALDTAIYNELKKDASNFYTLHVNNNTAVFLFGDINYIFPKIIKEDARNWNNAHLVDGDREKFKIIVEKLNIPYTDDPTIN